jgi:hypothetical protein
MKRVSAWAAGIALLFGSAHLALALHRHTAAQVQVTTAPSQTIGGQAFAGQGAILTFHSDADLMGNGNTVPQVFVFDLGERSKKKKKGLYQVTSADQACLDPTAAKRARVLGFVSTGDILGNGSTGRQIFVSTRAKWKLGKVPLFQLTRGPGESFAPKVSGNGRAMFFSSNADLNGQSLTPGNHLYRSELRQFLRSKCAGYPCPSGPGIVPAGLDTVTPFEAFNPSPSFLGNLVAFESTGDVAGNGCVNGSRQIFVKDYVDGSFEQLTFGTGDSRNPVITGDGSRVVFESDADLLGTGSTKTQVFLADRSQNPPKLTQLTFGTDGNSTKPSFAILTSGGFNRVVFLSDANLTGTGTPGTNQVYVLDELIRLAQITLVTDSITTPPTAVFSFVSFPNKNDLTGENPTLQSHLFLVNTFRFLGPVPGTPAPTPTPVASPGVPANIALALLTQQAADNGNNTLTTFIAATVSDAYGNPVPDGTVVTFTMDNPPAGAIITNGTTNQDPLCDPTNFETKTGVQVINQPGVAHSCVTYPGAVVGTIRRINATVGTLSESHDFTLPPPANECTANGSPCTDGNPCTVGDVCGGGSPGIPPTCQPGTTFTCPADTNPCTQDICNPFSGTCGVPVVCVDDANPCTDDVCDTLSGLCGIPNTGRSCDDNDLCTMNDTCVSGACQPGTPVVCTNDGNPCTNDICNPLTGTCGVAQVCQCP